MSTEQRLHHLALGARDVSRLAAFYREHFALPELARHHHDDGRLRSVWLDLGGAALMIEQTAEQEQRVDGVGAGLFLLALNTTPALRAQLCERLPEEARTEHTSYFRDPEGNRVAVSLYPLPTPTKEDRP